MKPKLQPLSVSETSTHVKNLEVFMKLFTLLTAMVFVSSTFAASAFEKKTKKEMLERNLVLTEKVESIEAHSKKEEVKEACAIIRDLLTIYPEQLKGIGSHMNNNKTKVIIARDEVLNQLIYVHKQSVVCDRGDNAEYVDAKDLEKNMKKIAKSLHKQKKLIEKEDTDFANEFYYHYEY